MPDRLRALYIASELCEDDKPNIRPQRCLIVVPKK